MRAPGRPLGIVGAGLLALAASIAVSRPAHAFDHAGAARRTLEHHIIPGYRNFTTAAAKQSRAIAAVCDTPSERSLADARGAFKEALLSWGRIEHIRFGPVSEENRHASLLFWPDPRGIARRQIGRVLAQQETDALSPDTLAAKSVAIQGFTALDFLLFDADSAVLTAPGPIGVFRCGYARAIATNIERVAQDTLQGWSDPAGFARVWLNPGPDNPVFLAPKETTQAIVQAYLTGLAQARNIRLGGPMGFKDRKARPLDPIVPSSNLALELVIANIEGLRALLVESDLADAAPDTAQARAMMRSVASELDMAIGVMRRVSALSQKPFQDRSTRDQLIAVGFPLKNAHDVGGAYLTREAGLSMGFNSLDGD